VPLASLIWPGDRKKVSGRPLPSPTMCSLEFKPPLVRPIACARSPLGLEACRCQVRLQMGAVDYQRVPF
jgi:hypothetical protein